MRGTGAADFELVFDFFMSVTIEQLDARAVVFALNHLDAGRLEAAANVLRVEYDRSPGDWEVARLANMIHPCGMVAEARRELVRLKLQAGNF